MNIKTIADQLDRLQLRAVSLRADGGRYRADDPALAEALEELGAACEEIRVAGAELDRQEAQIARMRASLLDENNRYRDLFERAPDAYLVTDIRGVIGDANIEASALLNVPHEFLAGKPLVNHLALESRAAFRDLLDLLQAADISDEIDMVIHPRNREPFDGGLKVSVARDARGRAIAYRWTVRDISRRQALFDDRIEIRELLEQQINAHVASEMAIEAMRREIDTRERDECSLRNSECLYRAIVEHCLEAVALVHADGTVLYASPATSQILGFDPEEAPGQSIFGVVHPADRPAVLNLFETLFLSPGSAITAELRCRHADRRWRTVAVTAINRIDMPEVGAVMVYYRELPQRAMSR